MKQMQMIKLLMVFPLATFLTSCDNPLKDEDKDDEPKVWECAIAEAEDPDFSSSLGCKADFTTMASEPLDASIPGATSVKTVIDLLDGGPLYFQNSKIYQIHWDFVSANLSGGSKPVVPALAQFNLTEYYSPNRRFVLGAVTRYDGPGVWAYEIAPYDNATADMISSAYHQIADSCYFGDSLYFHPTSQAIEQVVQDLPSSIKVITTGQLYEDIDYQPLNFAASMGRLIFITAAELETAYVGFRDIVVLDAVPNDISVVSGIITQEFQTPLSHINVLSQNRGTPNMALRGAYTNSDLRALEGKWVELDVSPFEYTVTEVTQEDADAWWDANRPADVGVPNLDLQTTELRNIEDILDLENYDLGQALDSAIPAFGGKASHFAAFPHMDNEKVPYPKAFAIPVYYYWQFMEQNGFHEMVTQFLADSAFLYDPAIRDQQLEVLRDSMETAPVDSAFEAALLEKLNTEYPGVRMRFRSSTNAEDLDGFTGAGLYTSMSGDPNDPSNPVLDAVRTVWASVWYFRAYEERSYRNIDHQVVGMALLVHNSFPDEEANGVAITANPFDPSGLEPGFYINVQKGEESVVQPEPGITTDQFIYHFEMPGQPIVFMAHSNLVPQGTTVLTTAQTHDLGIALQEIHRFFYQLYGTEPGKWYAMDTEFKFDQPVGGDPTAEPVLFVKQARPYPGWGQ
ncbi:PEP/pyruvate-binding domain-containing protein [Fibrobacterota bacterium]